MTINTWSPQLPESAQVHILDKDLQPVNCRTLVDTGATTNFITEDLVKRLGIPTKGCHVPVGALNQLSTVARHTATATIRSKFNSYERTLTFLTIPKISSLIPDQPIDRSLINIPRNIKLADPEFHRPAPIDILLGSGTTLSLITVGQINLSTPTEPNLYLQKTMFGWVIGGSAPSTSPIHDISCHTTNALQFDLTRFWEVEEGPQNTSHATLKADTSSHSLLMTNKIARTKIATQSIPRLELCGALLLTSLLTTTKEALHIKIHRTFMWTDSTIVLHWIRTSPHLLKTFVANRVSEIQSRTDTADWRHISTSENPADLISRGQQPQEFIQPSIWQFGPTWLTTCLNLSTIDANILDKFSSWHKMQRVAARCLRWKRNNQEKGGLTADELARAHDALIKLLQRTHFRTELHKLKNNQRDVGGKFQRLAIFLDKDGILRVGGRLRHSPIPFSQRHPILLPKAHVTTLIIQAEHHTHLHAGVQNTLYAVRRRYWPIDGRSQVWKALKNCIPCIRARPPAVNYTMGDLPEARVTESRPFTHVGIDYCGPFFIKERKHRSRNQHKAYVAVFVCLAVKAVHLELVSDLTSEGFIAALKRFIARRGLCKAIYSDNGRNFVGADNELQELIKSNDYHQQLGNFLENRAIKWNFIPPRTPHFGGLWEAAVKSFKHHLTRVAGTEPFTFENFNTLIIEIEAVLNSRPLTPISSDPNDLIVLTPGHFLIGESLTSLRERNFVDVPTNRLSAWQHIQKLKQHFWKRWHLEYLNELTKRSKWKNGTHSIKEGTIVLLREDNVPPMQWILGRVLKAHPGSDGVVRVMTVKTATSVLNRSVKGLAPLLYQPGEEDDLATSVSTREAC
ncbi:uncharacterized protein LOC143432245 [Xylocopa sonorina]|uniref:uncharacterized protein LOC143432245 n=1 Tax=Xylocopa sonorina TaxID=1818115 RepID=UPI00403B2F5A